MICKNCGHPIVKMQNNEWLHDSLEEDVSPYCFDCLCEKPRPKEVKK